MKYPVQVAIGVVAGVFCFIAGIYSAACTPAEQGMPAQADVAAYGTAHTACIEGGNTRAEIDACRWGVKAQFCARFPAATTCQGFVPVDGGKTR